MNHAFKTKLSQLSFFFFLNETILVLGVKEFWFWAMNLVLDFENKTINLEN